MSQTQWLNQLLRRYSQMSRACRRVCRVQLRHVGRKRQEHDVVWHDETRRTVPAGTAEDQQGDGTDADALADFGQMFVHGLDADCRHDQRGAGAARRADGAEQVSPGKPPIAPDARTRAALGPDAGQRALLANAGFILKPDFDRPAGKLLRDCGAR